jgi:hypothetical protein
MYNPFLPKMAQRLSIKKDKLGIFEREHCQLEREFLYSHASFKIYFSQ